ncbi:MAG: hypothetical protein Q8P59_11890 [Dehalococcoidia bacterium]|nr:hypothetical protein [Dehalococcoidia bacterium]
MAVLGDGVGVDVAVGTDVEVGVGADVAAGTDVEVGVGVGLGVGCPPTKYSTCSLGGWLRQAYAQGELLNVLS